jgi:cell division protein FtsL
MATATIGLPRARWPRTSLQAARAGYPALLFVKRVDNSRLRREVDPAKRRECFLLLGLSSAIFLLGLCVAWGHFQSVQCGYQLEQLKAQRSTLEEWNHRLRLEQASLTDPQRIDVLARQRLGLVPPTPNQVIRVEPDGEPTSGSTVLARNWPALSGGVGLVSREQ